MCCVGMSQLCLTCCVSSVVVNVATYSRGEERDLGWVVLFVVMGTTSTFIRNKKGVVGCSVVLQRKAHSHVRMIIKINLHIHVRVKSSIATIKLYN